MIVTCESCHTKFRLNPDRLKGPKNKVRCSRCGSTFMVERPEDDEFIHVDLSEESMLDDEAFSAPPAFPGPMATKKQVKQSSNKRLILWIIPLVLILGILLWVLIGRNTSPTPSIGRTEQPQSPGAPDQSTISIMDSTQAYFIENAHNGQMFVVEGEILNESKNPVSFVLVEGKLYTSNNNVAQTQRCFPGNMMTREELTRMKVADIQNRMMNREGKDLMNVHIPSAKRVPFMLVFHNLPEMDSLSDYSIEVISAKPE
jgi:predicted Zn finger-like uncharacterized protein